LFTDFQPYKTQHLYSGHVRDNIKKKQYTRLQG